MSKAPKSAKSNPSNKSGKPPAASGNSPSNPPASKPPTDAQRPTLRSQFATDPEMVELVQMFVTELPGRINALNSAWSEQRVSDLTRLAHQLKGASTGYGFPTIGQAAATLESRLRSMPGTPSLEALAKEFRSLVDLCSRACVRGR